MLRNNTLIIIFTQGETGTSGPQGLLGPQGERVSNLNEYFSNLFVSYPKSMHIIISV